MKRTFSLSVCTSLQHLEKLDLCSIQVIILDSSRIKAELTTIYDTTKYKNKSSLSTDGLKSGGLA